jgi:toxin ParE1/3/4
MNNYFFTNKAVSDLSQIGEYTYEFWSENQADKYYFELLSDCQYLANHQHTGKNYNEIHPEILGYKSGQHIIFYRIKSKNEIEITRILHSSMDLSNSIQDK